MRDGVYPTGGGLVKLAVSVPAILGEPPLRRRYGREDRFAGVRISRKTAETRVQAPVSPRSAVDA
jgi:hypothetical protein